MFRNFFKTAVRNLLRNKTLSTINIFGLAVGLTTCLLIALFVIDELSYDRHNEKSDRLYRIDFHSRINGMSTDDNATPAPLSPILSKEYPRIENTARFQVIGNIVIRKGNSSLIQHNVFIADSSLFDVFGLHMIKGNPKTALTQPFSMVLSESSAKKLFNSIEIVGNKILINNVTNYTVTGVISDMPLQSHIHFECIEAMSESKDSRAGIWSWHNYFTYILARPGTSQMELDGYLREVFNKYEASGFERFYHATLNETEKKGGYFKFVTQPVNKIHLYSTLVDELEPTGSIQYVRLFIAIAFLILIIACINFMNLSTARSATRAREVGVRKVLGSSRSYLIMQFLFESVFTSLISLILALIMSFFILPYLNQLTGKNIQIDLLSAHWLFPGLFITAIIVGIAAGSYPAFLLSAFAPIKVLKGNWSVSFKISWFRNILVVFQFVIAMVLLVGTFVIFKQLSYIKNKNVGFDHNRIIILKNFGFLGIESQTFKSQLLKIPGVEGISNCSSLPTTDLYSWWSDRFFKDVSRTIDRSITAGDWEIDEDYITTLGMAIVKGRNFLQNRKTDSTAVLINETAAKQLGFVDPIQKSLYVLDTSVLRSYHIIGVVRDFNAGSLHSVIAPLVLRLSKQMDYVAIRLNSSNMPATLARIESFFQTETNKAGQPFEFTFMNDDFNRLYQSDQRTGKLFVFFSAFAILIACLGLFGLVTYAAEQRTKEIGIRKVIGSSVPEILVLLLKDFLKLIFIAFVIASPLAWIMMNLWLQDFAYRINISWWLFVLAGILLLVITIITVSFQAIRAALANPVKSLRAE